MEVFEDGDGRESEFEVDMLEAVTEGDTGLDEEFEEVLCDPLLSVDEVLEDTNLFSDESTVGVDDVRELLLLGLRDIVEFWNRTFERDCSPSPNEYFKSISSRFAYLFSYCRALALPWL